jgi:two-component system CheB/CheR fusion protein
MSDLHFENKRLLIVEDDDMSFLYLKQLLSVTGIAIVREKTGIDALEHFRNDPHFDLILMDIRLPDMDGKQVTREIRSLDAMIPVIAQTVDKSPAERELALESGCSDLITKPFSMEELFGMMSRLLKQ